VDVVKTPHGEFSLRKSAVGVSLYRAGRPLRVARHTVMPGDVFPVWHRDKRVLAFPRPPKLYGGVFLGTYDLDGNDITKEYHVRDRQESGL